MGILNIPKYDRPGARLIKNGAKSLTTSDLLAILLGKSKNESVLKMAYRLLSKYDLNRLEDLSVTELTEECSGDKVSALRILSFIELSKRYNRKIKGGFDKKFITCAKDVYDIFGDKYRNYDREALSIILLDTKNKIIGLKEEISVGILNSSLIHPREVFKEAIKNNANAIILVHNHPSGDCNPSEEDIEITENLSEVGKILDIKVLDHVIIGKDKWWSWNEKD